MLCLIKTKSTLINQGKSRQSGKVLIYLKPFRSDGHDGSSSKTSLSERRANKEGDCHEQNTQWRSVCGTGWETG